MFKEIELERYKRNIKVIGLKGQEILKKSSVAIFGLGGLGNFVLLNLALAGIGKIFLLDKDIVEISNLNRQFFYTEKDIGKKKVEIVSKKITKINPYINLEIFDKDISKIDPEILKEYDLFIDCFDNWKARLILFNIAEKLGKPVVHGAVKEWRGQVGFFKSFEKIKKYKVEKDIGSISSVVSLIASIQSSIAIRYLIEKNIEEFLLIIDLKNMKFEKYKI